MPTCNPKAVEYADVAPVGQEQLQSAVSSARALILADRRVRSLKVKLEKTAHGSQPGQVSSEHKNWERNLNGALLGLKSHNLLTPSVVPNHHFPLKEIPVGYRPDAVQRKGRMTLMHFAEVAQLIESINSLRLPLHGGVCVSARSFPATKKK